MSAPHPDYRDIKTIATAAHLVLTTADAQEKAAASLVMAEKWRKGELGFAFDIAPPDRPARPENPTLLDPAQMPRRRKAGTAANRTALLHAVAHIELNAIDLAWDIVCRFGAEMPPEFTDDWVAVGEDEARHFTMINKRLADFDCTYGDLPAHDGLWQASQDTATDLMGRLAIVPMVLEARGLDVTPPMMARLRKFGDDTSADILQIIYDEEVSHVQKGSKWFHHLASERGLPPVETFHQLVKTYFVGVLKRPFNDDARSRAELSPAYYEPLADA